MPAIKITPIDIREAPNNRFSLKVRSDIFLPFCFLSLKENTFETRKNGGVLFPFKKLFSFLRFSNFEILES